MITENLAKALSILRDAAVEKDDALRPELAKALLDEIGRLEHEVNRLMGYMPEHDTREKYRCTECGAWHLRLPVEPALSSRLPPVPEGQCGALVVDSDNIVRCVLELGHTCEHFWQPLKLDQP